MVTHLLLLLLLLLIRRCDRSNGNLFSCGVARATSENAEAVGDEAIVGVRGCVCWCVAVCVAVCVVVCVKADVVVHVLADTGAGAVW